MVVQSAMAGQGIAPGWSHIVAHAIDAGILQVACQNSLVSSDSYKLYARRGSKDRAEVRQVATWITQEMKLLEPHKSSSCFRRSADQPPLTGPIRMLMHDSSFGQSLPFLGYFTVTFNPSRRHRLSIRLSLSCSHRIDRRIYVKPHL